MEHPESHIGLADLNNLLIIIDECVKRSAFHPSEIAAVGAVRNRLAECVAHMAEPQAEQPEDPSADESEALATVS